MHAGRVRSAGRPAGKCGARNSPKAVAGGYCFWVAGKQQLRKQHWRAPSTAAHCRVHPRRHTRRFLNTATPPRFSLCSVPTTPRAACIAPPTSLRGRETPPRPSRSIRVPFQHRRQRRLPRRPCAAAMTGSLKDCLRSLPMGATEQPVVVDLIGTLSVKDLIASLREAYAAAGPRCGLLTTPLYKAKEAEDAAAVATRSGGKKRSPGGSSKGSAVSKGRGGGQPSRVVLSRPVVLRSAGGMSRARLRLGSASLVVAAPSVIMERVDVVGEGRPGLAAPMEARALVRMHLHTPCHAVPGHAMPCMVRICTLSACMHGRHPRALLVCMANICTACVKRIAVGCGPAAGRANHSPVGCLAHRHGWLLGRGLLCPPA
eukprot:359937-Chlamydomonas_euryale.AAC.30